MQITRFLRRSENVPLSYDLLDLNVAVETFSVIWLIWFECRIENVLYDTID